VNFHRKHMRLVDAVNDYADDRLRYEADIRLHGWLDGLSDCGINTGLMLIEADNEQFSRGFNLTMCGGVFLNHSKAEEVAQIEDTAFADECERDKVASLHQTDLW